ncbi:hypothetical protein CEUSTIGMA_g9226.t1 [Chlamydomonas eustigma]|uniref:Uncharacterized protein n=1 Tax=Chlamydomonas eustigma TaxID=1157962 RepID=A0A250XFD1_9CHLO|nr:hypothetical protein CEUSTIGMA_g9226.t1 [Chlamydomonas eustigma]|eukprot:GAX81798.1 hypothetical protein CEUSTIGMA_g9226.t1 [Chlamydomonas eustigma]
MQLLRSTLSVETERLETESNNRLTSTDVLSTDEKSEVTAPFGAQDHDTPTQHAEGTQKLESQPLETEGQTDSESSSFFSDEDMEDEVTVGVADEPGMQKRVHEDALALTESAPPDGNEDLATSAREGASVDGHLSVTGPTPSDDDDDEQAKAWAAPIISDSDNQYSQGEEVAPPEAEGMAEQEEVAPPETEDMAGDEAAPPEAAGMAGEEAAPPETEDMAGEEAAPPEAEDMAGEEAATPTAEDMAGEEAAPPEVEGMAGEEAAPPETEDMAGEEAAPPTAEDMAGEEAAPPETEDMAGEEAAPFETEGMAREEAAPPEAEGMAGEEAAPPETEGMAGEEARTHAAEDLGEEMSIPVSAKDNEDGEESGPDGVDRNEGTTSSNANLIENRQAHCGVQDCLNKSENGRDIVPILLEELEEKCPASQLASEVNAEGQAVALGTEGGEVIALDVDDSAVPLDILRALRAGDQAALRAGDQAALRAGDQAALRAGDQAVGGMASFGAEHQTKDVLTDVGGSDDMQAPRASEEGHDLHQEAAVLYLQDPSEEEASVLDAEDDVQEGEAPLFTREHAEERGDASHAFEFTPVPSVEERYESDDGGEGNEALFPIDYGMLDCMSLHDEPALNGPWGMLEVVPELPEEEAKEAADVEMEEIGSEQAGSKTQPSLLKASSVHGNTSLQSQEPFKRAASASSTPAATFVSTTTSSWSAPEPSTQRALTEEPAVLTGSPDKAQVYGEHTAAASSSSSLEAPDKAVPKAVPDVTKTVFTLAASSKVGQPLVKKLSMDKTAPLSQPGQSSKTFQPTSRPLSSTSALEASKALQPTRPASSNPNQRSRPHRVSRPSSSTSSPASQPTRSASPSRPIHQVHDAPESHTSMANGVISTVAPAGRVRAPPRPATTADRGSSNSVLNSSTTAVESKSVGAGLPGHAAARGVLRPQPPAVLTGHEDALSDCKLRVKELHAISLANMSRLEQWVLVHSSAPGACTLEQLNEHVEGLEAAVGKLRSKATETEELLKATNEDMMLDFHSLSSVPTKPPMEAAKSAAEAAKERVTAAFMPASIAKPSLPIASSSGRVSASSTSSSPYAAILVPPKSSATKAAAKPVQLKCLKSQLLSLDALSLSLKEACHRVYKLSRSVELLRTQLQAVQAAPEVLEALNAGPLARVVDGAGRMCQYLQRVLQQADSSAPLSSSSKVAPPAFDTNIPNQDTVQEVQEVHASSKINGEEEEVDEATAFAMNKDTGLRMKVEALLLNSYRVYEKGRIDLNWAQQLQSKLEARAVNGVAEEVQALKEGATVSVRALEALIKQLSSLKSEAATISRDLPQRLHHILDENPVKSYIFGHGRTEEGLSNPYRPGTAPAAAMTGAERGDMTVLERSLTPSRGLRGRYRAPSASPHSAARTVECVDRTLQSQLEDLLRKLEGRQPGKPVPERAWEIALSKLNFQICRDQGVFRKEYALRSLSPSKDGSPSPNKRYHSAVLNKSGSGAYSTAPERPGTAPVGSFPADSSHNSASHPVTVAAATSSLNVAIPTSSKSASNSSVSAVGSRQHLTISSKPPSTAQPHQQAHQPSAFPHTDLDDWLILEDNSPRASETGSADTDDILGVRPGQAYLPMERLKQLNVQQKRQEKRYAATISASKGMQKILEKSMPFSSSPLHWDWGSQPDPGLQLSRIMSNSLESSGSWEHTRRRQALGKSSQSAAAAAAALSRPGSSQIGGPGWRGTLNSTSPQPAGSQRIFSASSTFSGKPLLPTNPRYSSSAHRYNSKSATAKNDSSTPEHSRTQEEAMLSYPQYENTALTYNSLRSANQDLLTGLYSQYRYTSSPTLEFKAPGEGRKERAAQEQQQLSLSGAAWGAAADGPGSRPASRASQSSVRAIRMGALNEPWALDSESVDLVRPLTAGSSV